MKILTYLFLMALLCCFAFTVHVATQKNEFDIQKTVYLKVPKAQVFQYLNDCRNWQTFSYARQTDPSQTFTFPVNTIGLGGFCAWEGNRESGKLRISHSDENKLLVQKIQLNGIPAEFVWQLKDSLKGTLISWRYRGSVNFSRKVAYAFQGGIGSSVSHEMQQTLRNLNRSLHYEFKTYSVNLQGITKKKGCYYLAESIQCKTPQLQKNIRILVPRMLRFFTKNKLTALGAPFVLYHAYDYPKGYSKISVCLAVKDSIFTSPGSQISSGVLQAFTCYKTQLKGDYMHLAEARNKTRAYFEKNHIQENRAVPLLEVYTKSSTQIANPSQWQTDLYFPIKLSASIAVSPAAKDTIK